MGYTSKAKGRFIFEEAFAEKRGDLIQHWIDNYEPELYGFKLVDNKLGSDKSIEFQANGLWAYCLILPCEGIGWTGGDPEKMSPRYIASRKAVTALTKALADEKSKVRVEYTDYEPECRVFYEARATLSYENEEDFEVEEEYHHNLDYTPKNICEKGFGDVAGAA